MTIPLEGGVLSVLSDSQRTPFSSVRGNTDGHLDPGERDRGAGDIGGGNAARLESV